MTGDETRGAGFNAGLDALAGPGRRDQNNRLTCTWPCVAGMRVMKPLLDLVQTLNIRALHREVVQLNQRMRLWESRMANLTETITIIGDATTRQGEGIRAVATQLDDLRARVTAGDTTAVELLTPIAARLNEHADALAAMANPDTPGDPVPVPVPDPEPVPVPTDS